MESEGNSIIQTLDASLSITTPGFYPNIFDGTPQDTTGYNSVRILCTANCSGYIKAMHSIDNSLWDINYNIDYPGSATVLGQPLFVTRPVQAKWYKTQFINPNDTPCDLRIQTMLHQESNATSALAYGSDDGGTTARVIVTDSLGRIVPAVTNLNSLLWSAAAVVSNDVTQGLDISSVRAIDVFGSTTMPCNIEIEYSGDDSNYYTSNNVILVPHPQGGNYHANLSDVGARYIRFRCDSTGTVTLVLNGK